MEQRGGASFGHALVPQFMAEKTTNVVDSACSFLNSLQKIFGTILGRLNVVNGRWNEILQEFSSYEILNVELQLEANGINQDEGRDFDYDWDEKVEARKKKKSGPQMGQLQAVPHHGNGMNNNRLDDERSLELNYCQLNIRTRRSASVKLKIKEKLVFSKLFPSSLAHSIGDQRKTLSARDVGRLGASGGGSGVVHPVIAWAAVSIASEDKGGGGCKHSAQSHMKGNGKLNGMLIDIKICSSGFSWACSELPATTGPDVFPRPVRALRPVYSSVSPVS
ncbi:hypothetical protein Cgig2_008597 [Carnegiea gigantea]|uniref:Uncharacterized protein n=1 Tax=Carnegiea gigantea TaxID=171969 RepID=A0A9Q1JVJ8_9CARY|nr:hypothetical protein Cgig2_008597 [Carnegiea gigantea]